MHPSPEKVLSTSVNDSAHAEKALPVEKALSAVQLQVRDDDEGFVSCSELEDK